MSQMWTLVTRTKTYLNLAMRPIDIIGVQLVPSKVPLEVDWTCVF